MQARYRAATNWSGLAFMSSPCPPLILLFATTLTHIESRS